MTAWGSKPESVSEVVSSPLRRLSYDDASPAQQQAKRPLPTVSEDPAKRLRTDSRSIVYSFLQNPVDSERRPQDHPDYDRTTLYIPEVALKAMSPSERMFWKVKQRNFDAVLFFRKGTFYELYSADAEIGHSVLGLKMTGSRASGKVVKMAGVPLNSFTTYAARLVNRGYRVARVDYTAGDLEGAESKEDGIIDRTLAEVLTSGTLLDSNLLPDGKNYLLAIKEDATSGNFGVCFIDISTKEFVVGAFSDDRHRSNFETLLVRIKPVEVLYERSTKAKQPDMIASLTQPCGLSKASHRIIRQVLTAPRIVDLRPLDFPLISADEVAGLVGSEDTKAQEVLHVIEESTLAAAAAGCLLNYLRKMNMDEQVYLSMCDVSVYDASSSPSYMILDGQALSNLELLQNNTNGSTAGTLLGFVDRCSTPFGRRMIRQWVIRPLRRIADINDRYTAIESIASISEVIDQIQSLLRGLPDLERLLTRIQTGRGRPSDLLQFLNGFDTAQTILNALSEQEAVMQSSCLARLMHRKDHFKRALSDFAERWDIDMLRSSMASASGGSKKASREAIGVVLRPLSQADGEYQHALEGIDGVRQEMEAYVTEEQRRWGGGGDVLIREVHGKSVLEVPKHLLQRMPTPSDYALQSETKTCRRFSTEDLTRLLSDLADAEDRRDQCEKTFIRQACDDLMSHYHVWVAIVRSLAEIDALISLANVSFCEQGDMARPELQDDGIIELLGSWHPFIRLSLSDEFVQNDIRLGGSESTVILTGPNMGGKSTILRQVALSAVLAQIGCYVPCKGCKMQPLDRIFVRIGASDRILSGQSTFLVELQETANIVNNATPCSLVLLDELGRGTSTFDGYAIAFAVLYHLVTQIKCFCLFSTHLHLLTEDCGGWPGVGLWHMGSEVDQERGEVRFTYRMTQGVCSKSFGVHVAVLAGIPSVIAERADDMSASFTETVHATRELNPFNWHHFMFPEEKQIFTALYKEVVKLLDAPAMDLDRLCRLIERVRQIMNLPPGPN
eukprot:CAMPEP_0184652594 /NCGR_PEP_ID=MMETSP0308-20130426/10289_1 /TAXON_ID=38269 /ORGANISM="Gloeochaete witrockiana, Strain SAG 46.84" /LENGTH=1012 /DNA_ID=CAMNT_0027087569 /DNA_START=116 /DNA_END=3154 /DNA_ORIENTATION=+